MGKIKFVVILIIGFSSNIYSQAVTDSTIAMIAFWSIDDEAIYEFKEVEDKLSKGEKTLKTSTYDVRMTIVDSTENKYSLKWEYENIKRDYKLEPFEEELMEICADIPVQYRTDELGTFETIENWKEMKGFADKAFNRLISEKKDLPDSISVGLKNMLSAMFESEEQMNYWARDLKFFHYLYGANLNRKTPFEGIKLYSNPFIKKIMPGTQRIEVIAVDEENWIAKIKVKSGIDGDKAKDLMIDFIKQNMENSGIKDESEIKREDIPNYSVTEEIDCTYDILTGYILKGSYSKLTKLNDDYKLTTYEYKLKN
jgi:hypothetical protein